MYRKIVKMNPSVEEAVTEYVTQLAEAGAASAQVIKPADNPQQIIELNTLENVTIPESLAAYLTLVGGYDHEQCRVLDVYEPEFAWGMFPIDIQFIPKTYQMLAGIGGDENPDYWPMGFLPILWGGSGDHVVVNCIQGSPTYGGVYDLDEAMGASPIASGIISFLQGCTQELTQGLRVYREPGHSTISNISTYGRERARYFDRHAGSNSVDWK